MSQDIKLFWLRNDAGHPVACIASKKISGTAAIGFSLSIRNPKDEINKATGRNVALGRLNSSRHLKVVEAASDVKRVILSNIAADKHLPARVRTAAANWLKNNPVTPTAAPAA